MQSYGGHQNILHHQKNNGRITMLIRFYRFMFDKNLALTTKVVKPFLILDKFDMQIASPLGQVKHAAKCLLEFSKLEAQAWLETDDGCGHFGCARIVENNEVVATVSNFIEFKVKVLDELEKEGYSIDISDLIKNKVTETV